MTVTIDAPMYTSINTVLLTWSSDLVDPTYRIYVNGLLTLETLAESYLLSVATGASPLIEITDDGSDPGSAWPERFILSWRSTLATETYQVQEEVGASWVTRAVIPATDARHYNWTSDVVEDGEAKAYRIVPIGTNGNEGSPIAFSLVMVRIPTPPASTWSYDEGTGVLTVTPEGV